MSSGRDSGRLNLKDVTKFLILVHGISAATLGRCEQGEKDQYLGGTEFAIKNGCKAKQRLVGKRILLA